MKTTLKTKLDRLWSKTVRERDKRCMKHIGSHQSQLNSHHVIFRSKGDILRWDIWNGISLCCMPCHKWHEGSAHMNNEEFNKWFCKTYPNRWKYLQKQKNKEAHFKDYHYEIIKNAIENLIPIGDIDGLD